MKTPSVPSLRSRASFFGRHLLRLCRHELLLLLLLPLFTQCSSLTIEGELDVPRKMSCANKAFLLDSLCDNEVDLLTRAFLDPASKSMDGINKKYLKKLSKEKGLAYATAVFFQRVTQEKGNQEYLLNMKTLSERINKEGVLKFKKENSGLLLVMVPGMWYDNNAAIGGDGIYIRQAAKRLGMDEVLLKVKPDGTLSENGMFICNWLGNYKGNKKIILSSISKGASDIKRAMQLCQGQDFFKNVIGWLNVGGINRGSPGVDMVENNCLYRWRADYFFSKNKYSSKAFYELGVNKKSPLQEDLIIPPHMKVVNVIATPIWRHVTVRAEEAYKTLAEYGPNDGLTVLADSYMPGAVNLSLWGTDHYFAIPEKRNVLLYAAFLDFMGEK